MAVTQGRKEAAEAWELLGRIVDQDVEENPGDGGGPAIRQGVAPDRVISVVDPEMRHGRKSASQRTDGYKTHLLTDHDTELVLGVSVAPANCPDGPQTAPLVEAARHVRIPVTEMLGDTAYGDGDTRVTVEAAGARVTAKTQPPATTGKFTKTVFAVDPQALWATCPAAQTATHTTTSHDHKGRHITVLHFEAAACAACPQRERCTINPDGRSLTLNFHEARLQAARADQARPATRRKLRRRAVIERKITEAKRHGMGKAHYRDARKVLLQQRPTARLLNLKHLLTLLDTPGASQAA